MSLLLFLLKILQFHNEPFSSKLNLDIEANRAKYMLCNSSRCGANVGQLSSKYFQQFKNYRADTKVLTEGQPDEQMDGHRGIHIIYSICTSM